MWRGCVLFVRLEVLEGEVGDGRDSICAIIANSWGNKWTAFVSVGDHLFLQLEFPFYRSFPF